MRIVSVSALLATAVVSAPLAAQVIEADVSVRSGPVDARVHIDDGYSSYRYPVVVRRPGPVVIVYREYVPRGRSMNWYRKHGFRPVRMYWYHGQYYYRPWRPGMFEVIIFERGGRHFWMDERDDWHRYRGRNDRDYGWDYRDDYDGRRSTPRDFKQYNRRWSDNAQGWNDDGRRGNDDNRRGRKHEKDRDD